MPQLLVRNVPESVAKKLKLRAAEHGVSAEEEHRRILSEVLQPETAEMEKPYTLFDHIRKLGEIAPDFDFESDRTHWESRPLDL